MDIIKICLPQPLFYCCKETHDHSNTYRRMHLVEDSLTVSGSQSMIVMVGNIVAGRHDAGEVAESSVSRSIGNRKREDTRHGLRQVFPSL